jgi:hypothetical protein
MPHPRAWMRDSRFRVGFATTVKSAGYRLESIALPLLQTRFRTMLLLAYGGQQLARPTSEILILFSDRQQGLQQGATFDEGKSREVRPSQHNQSKM